MTNTRHLEQLAESYIAQGEALGEVSASRFAFECLGLQWSERSDAERACVVAMLIAKALEAAHCDECGNAHEECPTCRGSGVSRPPCFVVIDEVHPPKETEGAAKAA